MLLYFSRLATAPIPTPRQQQIHKGIPKMMRRQQKKPTILPITIPIIAPTLREEPKKEMEVAMICVSCLPGEQVYWELPNPAESPL